MDNQTTVVADVTAKLPNGVQSTSMRDAMFTEFCALALDESLQISEEFLDKTIEEADALGMEVFTILRERKILAKTGILAMFMILHQYYISCEHGNDGKAFTDRLHDIAAANALDNIRAVIEETHMASRTDYKEC